MCSSSTATACCLAAEFPELENKAEVVLLARRMAARVAKEHFIFATGSWGKA